VWRRTLIECPFGWGTKHANVALDREVADHLKRPRGVPLPGDYGVSGSRP